MTMQPVAPSEWTWVRSTTYSQAVRVDDLLYTSGVAPFDDAGNVVGVADFETQARRTVANLARLLDEAGSSLSQIIRQQVFLRRPQDVDVFKRVRAELYVAPYPASILLVVTGHAHPDMLIEIACEARIGGDR